LFVKSASIKALGGCRDIYVPAIF